jgi:hypothetical protein
MTNVDRAACGGLLSRVKVFDKARISFRDGSAQPVRVDPGYSQEILASLPEGTEFFIDGDSSCAEGGTWWPIRLQDGRQGWIAEDQNGIYLLEPVE